MMLMPAKPGTCPECAVDHASGQPHNKDSIYYQYHFYALHGRWPTWDDALAHCSNEIREHWTEALRGHGIEVQGNSDASH